MKMDEEFVLVNSSWRIEDVLHIAENEEIEISSEDALAFLQGLKHESDSVSEFGMMVLRNALIEEVANDS